MPLLQILIPTYCRPAALAVTLAGLTAQDFRDFGVIVSDQTEEAESTTTPEVQTAMAVLRTHGHPVEVHRHLPRRGLAEHRQFLLDCASAPLVLFLDDDLLLEPWAVGTMVRVIQRERCGLVGMGVIGLSFIEDVRPHEQQVEFWDGPVRPEAVRPDTPAWERHCLHNAANLYHLQEHLGLAPGEPRPYKIAWVGGCSLYDSVKLRTVGGFSFWKDLPRDHCGEDVLAQQRVMARYGGCGVLPSGVYHQELPTTVPDRTTNAPRVLGIDESRPLERSSL